MTARKSDWKLDREAARWLAAMDAQHGLAAKAGNVSEGERTGRRPGAGGVSGTRPCVVCGAPAKRVYCGPDCFRIGVRDYKRDWSSSPEQRKKKRRWAEAHREERAAYNAAHYAANRDRYRAVMRRWYAANRDRACAMMRRWYAARKRG
jgi:hypothetical protein